ncbi:MAG: peptide deformylase [Bacteroidetes bacterium]|nr:peptide deformylase [Bacteroidota bacterium]MDA0985334.1 peptide deformylase [Bacteroidota bacterium]
MIRPIVAYGTPVLKTKAKEIDQNTKELSALIEDMWETMYASNGVGLAAPQIGLPIRLFVIDAAPFAADEELDPKEIEELEAFKRVFINPVLLKEEGEKWDFNEGCLSIPDVREDVERHENITIEFLDENFKPQTLQLEGLCARVVQHEYDHIEGILFTDHLSPLKKRLLKNKLNAISKGAIHVDYPMKFSNQSKRK